MYTVGIQYYRGYHMPLYICSGMSEAIPSLQHYKLAIIQEDDVSVMVNLQSIHCRKPTALYLNEKDCLNEINGKVQMIFFSPILVNKAFTVEAINAGRKKVKEIDEFVYLSRFIREPQENVKAIELSQLSVIKLNHLIFKMSQQLKNQPDNFWPCRSKAYLDEILFHLLYPDHFDYSAYAADSENLPENIQSYINSHISEDISISALTKEFSLNRTTLEEKFNEYFKVSPMKYITNQRIELSKVILANTGVPIAEICTKVGLNSPAYFSKIFKAATGLTPSMYRTVKSKVD